MMDEPLYSHIKVQLTGQDGNAFNLISLVRTALRKNGVPQDKIEEFVDDAMSGDYDHVLQTCMKWVDVS